MALPLIVKKIKEAEKAYKETKKAPAPSPPPPPPPGWVVLDPQKEQKKEAPGWQKLEEWKPTVPAPPERGWATDVPSPSPPPPPPSPSPPSLFLPSPSPPKEGWVDLGPAEPPKASEVYRTPSGTVSEAQVQAVKTALEKQGVEVHEEGLRAALTAGRGWQGGITVGWRPATEEERKEYGLERVPLAFTEYPELPEWGAAELWYLEEVKGYRLAPGERLALEHGVDPFGRAPEEVWKELQPRLAREWGKDFSERTQKVIGEKVMGTKLSPLEALPPFLSKGARKKTIEAIEKGPDYVGWAAERAEREVNLYLLTGGKSPRERFLMGAVHGMAEPLPGLKLFTPSRLPQPPVQETGYLVGAGRVAPSPEMTWGAVAGSFGVTAPLTLGASAAVSAASRRALLSAYARSPKAVEKALLRPPKGLGWAGRWGQRLLPEMGTPAPYALEAVTVREAWATGGGRVVGKGAVTVTPTKVLSPPEPPLETSTAHLVLKAPKAVGLAQGKSVQTTLTGGTLLEPKPVLGARPLPTSAGAAPARAVSGWMGGLKREVWAGAEEIGEWGVKGYQSFFWSSRGGQLTHLVKPGIPDVRYAFFRPAPAGVAAGGAGEMPILGVAGAPKLPPTPMKVTTGGAPSAAAAGGAAGRQAAAALEAVAGVRAARVPGVGVPVPKVRVSTGVATFALPAPALSARRAVKGAGAGRAAERAVLPSARVAPVLAGKTGTGIEKAALPAVRPSVSGLEKQVVSPKALIRPAVSVAEAAGVKGRIGSRAAAALSSLGGLGSVPPLPRSQGLPARGLPRLYRPASPAVRLPRLTAKSWVKYRYRRAVGHPRALAGAGRILRRRVRV